MSDLAAPPKSHDRSAVQVCRWLLGYAGRRLAGLVAVLTTMLLGTAMSVIRPWPLKVVVDSVISGQPIPPGLSATLAWLPGTGAREVLLGWCLAAMLLIALLGWAVSVAASQANIAFGQRMVYDLAADLFGHLERLSLSFHARRPVGDLIRRVTTDSNCVSKIVMSALPVASSITCLLAMFAVMWRSTSSSRCWPWLWFLT